MTKIIFLDIDGVLVTVPHIIKLHSQGVREGLGEIPDPECIERLNKLCRDTGAKIVVSSSWRGDPEIVQTLKNMGITGDFHPNFRTPNIATMQRGNEIDQWLKRYGQDVKSFVILEDEPGDLLPYQRPRTPAIDGAEGSGFQEEHYLQSIKILNTPLRENEIPKTGMER